MLLLTNNVKSSFHIGSIDFCSFSASFHWLLHQEVTLYAFLSLSLLSADLAEDAQVTERGGAQVSALTLFTLLESWMP